MTETLIAQSGYLSDYLLLEVLEQLWTQEVYEPIINMLLNSFENEMRIISDLDRIDEIYSKKHTVIKAFKSMVKSERKQVSSFLLARVINNNYVLPSVNVSQTLSAIVEKTYT